MTPDPPKRDALAPFQLFLARWLVQTLAVMVAAKVVKGIHYESFTDLLVASLLLGILNAVLRPLLLLLSLPVVVFTLGLFALVINALLLMFVGQLVKSFHVESFWAAFFGGLVISIVTVALNTLTGTGQTRIDLRRRRFRGRARDPHDGDGPVIDV